MPPRAFLVRGLGPNQAAEAPHLAAAAGKAVALSRFRVVEHVFREGEGVVATLARQLMAAEAGIVLDAVLELAVGIEDRVLPLAVALVGGIVGAPAFSFSWMTRARISGSGMNLPSLSSMGLPSGPSFALWSSIRMTVPSGTGLPGLAALSEAGWVK